VFSTSCSDRRRPKTLCADGACAGVPSRLTLARESATSRRGVWRRLHKTRDAKAAWRIACPWPPPVVRRDRLSRLCLTRAAPDTARAGLAILVRASMARPSIAAARSASQGRVRVFDADVAVTYTAAGFTDAWQTDPHGRDSMQPLAWLLDALV
jgi:hypothetical protein